MNRVINFQMSLFGSFINIKPQNALVINLLQALQVEEFVPGSADIATVDVKTGKMSVDSRMQMVSPDKTWTIVFLPERIDINYNYVDGTEKYTELIPLLSMGRNLVQKVFSVFPDTTGNRLAVSSRIELEEMSKTELKRFFTRFTNPLSAYGDDEFAEWSIRFNSRGDIQVSDDANEQCNRIVEMSQFENVNLTMGENNNTLVQESTTSNIVVLMDINTSATDVSFRFKYDNLLLFSQGAEEFMESIIKEVEGE